MWHSSINPHRVQHIFWHIRSSSRTCSGVSDIGSHCSFCSSGSSLSAVEEKEGGRFAAGCDSKVWFYCITRAGQCGERLGLWSCCCALIHSVLIILLLLKMPIMNRALESMQSTIFWEELQLTLTHTVSWSCKFYYTTNSNVHYCNAYITIYNHLSAVMV